MYLDDNDRLSDVALEQYAKLVVAWTYGKHLCVIILNFDWWLGKRCRLKIFLIYSSGNPSVRRSRTIWVILAEDIMRNISVLLFF